MRFIAALCVFSFHALCTTIFAADAFHMFPTPAGVALYAWQGNWVGVSFFFILSGFVLTWSVRHHDTTRAFWRRRFFKIYPNHLLTLIAAAVLLGGVSKMALDLMAAILNALLLHSFFPDMTIWTSYNSVSWSLSNEALFYLLFPAVFLLIKRIRPERLWLWA